MRLNIFKKIILVIFIAVNIFGRNFSEKTKVLTESGYKKISELNPGDFVLSENKNGEIEKSKIIVVHSKKVKGFLKLKINGEILDTTLDQKFYDQENKLIPLGKNSLKESFSIIKTLNNFIKIDSIEIIEKEEVFYDLTLLKNHNFYVTEKNIKVHNWFFEITLTWAFDATTIEFVGFSIGIGAAIVGTVVAACFLYDRYGRKAVVVETPHNKYQIVGNPGCFSQTSPDDYDHFYTQHLIDSTPHFSGIDIPTSDFYPDEFSNNQPKNSPEIKIEIKKQELIDSDLEIQRIKNISKPEIIELKNEDEKYLVDKEFLDNVVESTFYQIPEELKISESSFITISKINENFLNNIGNYKSDYSKNDHLIINYGNFLFEAAKDSITEKIQNPTKTLYNYSFGKIAAAGQLLKISANLFLILGHSLVDFEKGKNEFFNYTTPVSNFYNHLKNSNNEECFKIASSIFINFVIDSKVDKFLSFSFGKFSNIVSKQAALINSPNLSKSEIIKTSTNNHLPGQNLNNFSKCEQVLDIEKTAERLVADNNKIEHIFFKDKHRFFEILHKNYNYSYEELCESVRARNIGKFNKYKNNLSNIVTIYFNSAIGDIGDKKFFRKGSELVGYVHGYKILFRGEIEDGIFKVGTAFIPIDFIMEK